MVQQALPLPQLQQLTANATLIAFLLIFSLFYFVVRCLGLSRKFSILLSATVTFSLPFLLPTAFDKVSIAATIANGVPFLLFSLFLLFVGTFFVGKKGVSKRELSDIEKLGKLEFRKAELIGQLSLAKSKGDKKLEKSVRKELERVESEILKLKKKLGRKL